MTRFLAVGAIVAALTGAAPAASAAPATGPATAQGAAVVRGPIHELCKLIPWSCEKPPGY